MNYKLNDVANIVGGQTFRGKAEGNSTSNIHLVQIKNITEGILSEIKKLSYANIDPHKLKVRLQKGDLLLPLRGDRQAALLFNVDCSEKSITTTTNQVAVLRPNQELVLPIYLLWYLNTQYFKETLSRLKTGTTISHLSIKRLSEIDIDLPSLEVQAQVVDIYRNWNDQKDTLVQLIDNGEKLIESICFEKIKN